jgi:hypothetical protein
MRTATAMLLLLVLAPIPARADEGFWTFDRFPRQLVKTRYGVEVSDAVLRRAAFAAAEVSGQTGAFVSGRGLVAVKHGTIKPCLHALREGRRSSGRFIGFCRDTAIRRAVPLFDRLYCRAVERAGDYDYVEHGYVARSPDHELRCPNLWVDRLTEIRDVTEQVQARLASLPAGLPPDQRTTARWKLLNELQSQCAGPEHTCQVASLHGGSRYELHRSRRYTDVRLVFAPDRRVADFGDLQDHLNFPDHDFKTAFVRAYERGQPAETPEFLRWSTRRVPPGELLLAVGHPAPASRYQLASGLERERDKLLASLSARRELRGLLLQIASQRPSMAPAFDFDQQNASILWEESRLRALSSHYIAERVAEERQLLEELERRRDPFLAGLRQALSDAARAHAAYLDTRDRSLAIDAFELSNLTLLAATAARLGTAPVDQRRQTRLTMPQNLDREAETARLELAFRIVQETFPSTDPFLRKVLQGQTARRRAQTLVAGTRLGDPSFRRRLALGGSQAVTEARDPMVELVQSILPAAEMVQEVRERARSLGQQAAEALAAARHRLRGDAVYPDGTGTVRIAFGAMAGYREAGRVVPPVTTLRELFDLSQDGGPYQLPPGWTAARSSLDLSTPLNVATDTDMFVPAVLVDARGDLIAVAFNGNRHYSGGDAFDATRSRIVSVHNAAVVELLRKVYRAPGLLDELGAHR